MGMKKILNTLFLLALVGCLLVPGGVASAADNAMVGSEKCKECHAEMAKSFATTIHAKAGAYGYREAGCESCHGPAGNHAASGDPAAIINPSKIDYEAASATCLACHTKSRGQMFWHGSVHEGQKMSCVACHKVHGGNERLLAAKNENDLCMSCHINVRADMYKRSRHPMRETSSFASEGRMTCSSCHNPHGARGERLIDAKSINDKCYECHFEKKAPRLWEHSPVKEDCLTCHNAHGSSNDKMLVTMIPRLCQQCHMQGRHQSAPLSPNSTFAFNRSCLNCHSMVHGSNHPSGAVLQR